LSSQRPKHGTRSGNRVFDFGFGNFGGHEERFKLTTRKIKAEFQHSPEKLGVTIRIAADTINGSESPTE